MTIDPAKLAEHVKDAPYFELPEFLGGKYYLPNFGTINVFGRPVELQLTKFMVLEVVVAVLMIAIFIPLSRKLASGKPPRGRFWNLFDAMILFVRDEMVRPAIGKHDAERFVPLILTLFFFILFANLMGLLPWCGSPTGALSVTAALALIAFATLLRAGITRFGPVKFWLSLCPHMELPFVLEIFLKPMILGIEIISLLIKHFILAVRLLANMFAGHLVLAVILGFIVAFANSMAWYGVMPASVLGAAALNLLELLVAFLQAYIFAFLTALFIGMVIHEH
jgi:F-type H+-transporting ATPase subunit a